MVEVYNLVRGMTTTKLAVINKSTLVSDADAKTMWLACKNQMYYHAAPLLHKRFMDSVFVPRGGVQPKNTFPIVLLDDPDQAGALGYHTEDPNGQVWGRVFARPVLQSGGTALHGDLSVSSVLSHEMLETFADLNVNLWSDRMDGTMVAVEVCDPVENDSYEVNSLDANGLTVQVSVSNFVLNEWFDPQAAPTSRFDYMKRVHQPLTMSPGGYIVVLNYQTGEVSQVFGSHEGKQMHMMKKPAHPASRALRRMGAHGRH